jgi:2,3-dihydroxybenzoate-AMP ligase
MKTAAGTTPWPDEFVEQYRREGYWRGEVILERIRAQAIRRPAHPAVIDGDVTFSYEELLDRVDACAARLIALGIAPDERIVLQLPNGWQFTVLALACFRVGIVPVMALPAHREHELRHLVDLSEAVAIAAPYSLRDFDHAALSQKLIESTATLRWGLIQDMPSGEPLRENFLDLEALCDRRDESTDGAVLPAPDPSSVALFLLSGGTTGLPKLIARTHDDYVCNVIETSRYAELDEDTVYLGTLPLGHNFPLACPGILGTWFVGGTVVSLPSPQAERAFEAIRRNGVTLTAAVPAVVAAWLDHSAAVGSDDLETLRVLQVGGARLADELAAKVEPVLGVRLQQVFGMAEGLINVTRLDDPTAVIVGSQGRPVSAADEILVVDEVSGKPVPEGSPGVLLTRGPYTPRGYFAAPEANARAFTPDGWYVTGDIVRVTAEGNLVVEGRSKDMINRGGENISAEEIENLVYRKPAVQLAAAVAMKDAQLGERVCVFVVVQPGMTVHLDELRADFDAWGVAAFKRPDRIVHLDELPLTKIGKIDKKALRTWLDDEVAS